jgi:hypothetical protein
MKVLVACEESQVVCNAFRAKGHEAYSCDILPTRGAHPEWHIQGDIMKHLNDGWELGIFHPMCTNLCNSGVRWMKNKDGSLNSYRHFHCINDGIFFDILLGEHCPIHNIPKVCIENPIPHKYAMFPHGAIQRKYDQIIQPWWFGNFGENETKATCLRLKGLPKLTKVNPLPEPHNHTIHRMPPGPNRARDRAVTFRGIAQAMAEQWGNLDKQEQHT